MDGYYSRKECYICQSVICFVNVDRISLITTVTESVVFFFFLKWSYSWYGIHVLFITLWSFSGTAFKQHFGTHTLIYIIYPQYFHVTWNNAWVTMCTNMMPQRQQYISWHNLQKANQVILSFLFIFLFKNFLSLLFNMISKNIGGYKTLAEWDISKCMWTNAISKMNQMILTKINLIL